MLETPVAAARLGCKRELGWGDENLFSGLQYKIQRTGYQEGVNFTVNCILASLDLWFLKEKLAKVGQCGPHGPWQGIWS